MRTVDGAKPVKGVGGDDGQELLRTGTAVSVTEITETITAPHGDVGLLAAAARLQMLGFGARLGAERRAAWGTRWTDG